MKPLYIALFLGLIFSACTSKVTETSEASLVEQVNTNKGKLFIIGGGKRPPSLVKRLGEEANLGKDNNYAVVLPMSSSEPDTSAYYGCKQFTDLGYTAIFPKDIANSVAPHTSLLDSIRGAKLVYITGGDQNRFMERVAGTQLIQAIHDCYKNGGTIAGTSAGAALMSQAMITGNEKKHPEYNSTFRNIESENIELAEGLGLFPEAIIDQHFVKRSRYNRLISAVIENPSKVGLGIDESTAILVTEGTKIEVVGESQVIRMMNKQKSPKVYEDKIGATSIQLDVFVPGDVFEI
ncbi:cyanophycinase [Sediminitomix flava]|uniref:Cyanophycinase n=1 Tax=Sediminitomix flava TaxID=379075 RepID=A0A316A370_SEDFL|nr:cyanophycinase [Sediminitomix flava]PWJ44157.1 cyanophycinase [Sediminitomix flava]